MVRLRRGKLGGSGWVPGGNSLTTAPGPRAMRSKISPFSGGYTTSMPHPRTAMEAPDPQNAPSCAAVSTPRAPPETTVMPARASASPKLRAISSPCSSASREPTTATRRASGARLPRT